ncbi:cytochrome P450 [Streptomyces lavendofoliae]|uniref:Biflaviolin synthase CYP158A2 n=1 Tax=Streptomyces lavendofoliae TaxID=67314 RepID=A0A918I038_9ACTN|nr:cytochrome P450 [Streptomyces lavendofoliae]GGU48500.1 biflaviolin synthase CYP158A2 [Streptomyces lavendofoliae]
MDETTTTAALPPVRHWPALDLFGVEFDPVLAELMREGPITRIKLPNGDGWAWLVTRYDDVRSVTNDPRFSRKLVVENDVTRLAPHFVPVDGAVGFEDPPDHTRLRRAVAPAFTTRGVERLRERARLLLDELVEEVLADGPPADLTERLLGPFPLAVVCELMGVPPIDRPRMHEWTNLILSSAHGVERSQRAKEDMCAYFADLLSQPRDGDDGDDEESVIGLLGTAVANGEITSSEAVGLALLIQIGGEAVTNNCGNMLFVLLTHPEHLARLRAEPAIRPRAIDELLRYIPHRSAVGLSRIAREDVTVAGVRIRAGEPVYVSYLAANRDPDVFPAPEALDFDRSPNPHVAFGYGPHFCVGAMLARMESELLVDAFLDRFPGLRFAVPVEEVRFRRGALIRGPESLPVTW